MTACLAAPWPSQQRGGRSTSERHSALARMKERHARSERLTPDEEPLPRSKMQQPRPPAQPRGSDSRPAPRQGLSGSGNMDFGSSRAEPWAAAWTPEAHDHMNLDDNESPPPKPQRPTPPEESSWKSQTARAPRSEKVSEDVSWKSQTERAPHSARCGPSDDGSRGNRVRGPADVKSARGAEADDECLPPGAHGADFKTLQAMIARGIQDNEAGAVKLETNIPLLGGDDEEEQRFRERQRQRREQEAGQREKEREQARQKRRQEQEERERRQAEELEHEEREELAHREARAQAEQQCRSELAAAVRIQAHRRGCLARAGKSCSVSGKPVLHWEPWLNQQAPLDGGYA